MDAPQPKIQHADPTHDYITDLPAHIKETILLKLPIKEVVRTTILSTKWIDAWVSIPNLAFKRERCTEPALIKMVDTVLLLHQGPIQKFKLVSNHACNEAIGRWLLILSRNGIKDLKLQFHRECKISFRLISCILLERLSLDSCSINIPSCFQGFMQLHTLILMSCNISEITLENLISSCPLRDYLVLCGHWKGRLHICASNLTRLEVAGEFRDICLETPKLASAAVLLLNTFCRQLKFTVARNRKESNIVRAIGHLLNIQELHINGEFLRYLAIGPIPENLAVVFDHLMDITLSMCAKQNEISVALCLLENAPNLEELSIWFETIDQPSVEAVWESKAIKDRLFKHLKVVKLEILYIHNSDLSLQYTKPLLEFAKFVLSTAPVLVRVNFIGLKAVMVSFEILKRFPKLSKNAEIAFV